MSDGRYLVRVGRDAGAALRFADAQDAIVSTHRAQIVFERCVTAAFKAQDSPLP